MIIRSILTTIVTVFILLLSATAGAQPDISAGSGSGMAGDSVTIPVQFTNNGSVVGLQFDLQFNNAVLEAGAITAGGSLSPHALSSSSPSPGIIRVVVRPPVLKLLPAVKDGVVVSIPFKIASGATAGSYPVSLINVILSDASAIAVNPATLTNGNISVEMPTRQLAVSIAGAGSGTVTSTPAGINCGVDCTEGYDHNTSVTLTAAAATGSVFTGWSGSGCSGTGNCILNMTSDMAVTATFAIDTQTYNLTLTKTGTGSGTVTSSPAGINCGTTCSGTYNAGSTINLTATPVSDSTFAGWSGDTDCADGIVAMNVARSCIARFNRSPQEYAMSVSVTGSGVVTSDPSGVSCPGDCSESYTSGVAIQLNAIPDSGYTFSGWGGDCTSVGMATTCTVTMDAGKSVSATFVSTRGLKGEYYDNPDLTVLSFTRTDHEIDFDWGSGSPDPYVDVDTFSVRWTGGIQIDHNETYTFYAVSDDGVRLWIDGYLLIDQWQASGVSDSGTMALTAGLHDIRMEFVDNSGDARVHLYWSSPSTTYAVIPQDHLYPPSDGNAPVLSWTGETNYRTDGLDPQAGDTNTSFTYRIKYTDADGDAPRNGYPRVHILEEGQEISGSPYAMSFTGGSYYGGAIYTYSALLPEGTTYTAYFDAKDTTGLQAVADPTVPTPATPVNGPDVNAPALLGDIDTSDRVDGFDLGRLGLAFGSHPGDSNWDPDADINGDGTVDDLDLDILKVNFGKMR